MSPAPSFWDNAASYHLAAFLSSLLHPHLLTTPINFGTQHSPCRATHVGFLRNLPPHLALAFWGPGFKYNLYSLGYLQRRGGSYSSDPPTPTNLHRLTVKDHLGNVIDHSTLTTSNLHPANPHPPRLPHPIAAATPALRTALPPVLPPPAAAVQPSAQQPPAAAVQLPAQQPPAAAVQPPVQQPPAAAVQPPHPPPPLPHLPHPPAPSAAAQKRFQAVADLHAAYAHPSDATLKAAITSGSIKTDVTPKDVDAYRAANGPCIPCLAGKLRDRPHPASPHSRGTHPGSDLYIDIHDLPKKSAGDSTTSIRCVCGFSSKLDIQGAKTKTSRDILLAILTVVAISYNAFLHTVSRVWTDSEAVFKSLRPALGIFGIELKLFTPLEHNRFFERYNLTLVTRSLAVRAGLPFLLPPKYDLQLDSDIATKHNALPNTRTGPDTCPYTIVTKQQPPPARGAFGDMNLINYSDEQRDTIGANTGRDRKSVPPGGIAMNVGLNTLWPYAPQFLLPNGKIVCREPRSPALKVAPLNFPPNPNWHPPLPTPAAPVQPLPTAGPSSAQPPTPPAPAPVQPTLQPNTLLQQSTLTQALDILLPAPKGTCPTTPPTDFTSANRFSALATDDDTDDDPTATTDPATRSRPTLRSLASSPACGSWRTWSAMDVCSIAMRLRMP